MIGRWVLLVASSLLGCGGATAPAAGPLPSPGGSAPASAASTSLPPPIASGPSAKVASAPAAPASAAPPALGAGDLEGELLALRKAGFEAAAKVIADRVS